MSSGPLTAYSILTRFSKTLSSVSTFCCWVACSLGLPVASPPPVIARTCSWCVTVGIVDVHRASADDALPARAPRAGRRRPDIAPSLSGTRALSSWLEADECARLLLPREVRYISHYASIVCDCSRILGSGTVINLASRIYYASPRARGIVYRLGWRGECANQALIEHCSRRRRGCGDLEKRER